MGVDKKVQAVNLARKIALHNSEVIYYVKNKLWLISQKSLKNFSDKQEKFIIMIRDFATNTDIERILANYKDNENHNITKIDIEAITEILLEGVKKK